MIAIRKDSPPGRGPSNVEKFVKKKRIIPQKYIIFLLRIIYGID